MKSPTLTRFYNLHGLGIAISSEPPVSEALHSRLRLLATNDPDSTALTFEFCTVPDEGSHVVEKPPEGARLVCTLPFGKVVYADGEDRLYMNHRDRVRVLCDLKSSHVRLSTLPLEGEDLWFASHMLFTLALIELLKRRGRYPLHAAGLSVNGKGILLAGDSGCGKSTLTLTLLRVGFDFLGDDLVFLVPGAEGLRVLAFPDEIDVTDETARWFPELHYLLNLPQSPRGRKRQVLAEEVYQAHIVWECKPSVIVFPRIAQTEKSVLEPMKPDEAFLELVPNILLTEAHSSQAHLDALAGLVEQSRCYRLETGRDFDALPMLLRQL